MKQQILSKYKRLRDILEENIRKNHFKEGPLPTERDLSSRYGVSRRTVRRALHELVEDGILTNVSRKGVFVRPRNRGTEKRRILGVLFWTRRIRDFGNAYYYGEMFGGMVEEASRSGYDLVTLGVRDSEDLKGISKRCDSQGVKGLLALAVSDDSWLEKIVGFGMPSVLVDYRTGIHMPP